MSNNGNLDDIHAKFIDINKELYGIWLNEILFSWRWWLNIALTIIPWLIWIKYRDRKNTIRLLFVGLTVAGVTEVLDVLGMSYGFWHYDWTVLPLFPIYIPWNFTLFPVTIMFLLQIKPKANVYIKALLFAAFSGYAMEPLFEKLGMYHNIKWSSFKSFIIYVFLYLFFNWIYNKAKRCEQV
jgi:hypothetical protein